MGGEKVKIEEGNLYRKLFKFLFFNRFSVFFLLFSFFRYGGGEIE